MHWFCLDDLSCCVDGTTQKYAVARPSVTTVWPIQKGTDLIQKEVIALQEARFSFDHSCAEVYLVPNYLVQAFHMLHVIVLTTLCGWPMQIVGPQLVVARR